MVVSIFFTSASRHVTPQFFIISFILCVSCISYYSICVSANTHILYYFGVTHLLAHHYKRQHDALISITPTPCLRSRPYAYARFKYVIKVHVITIPQQFSNAILKNSRANGMTVRYNVGQCHNSYSLFNRSVKMFSSCSSGNKEKRKRFRISEVDLWL